MIDCRHILLVVDPAMRRTPAFDCAVQMARRTGAVLHLYLFDYLSAVETVGLISPEVMTLARRAHIGDREDWLRDLALELQGHRITVHTGVIWGSPLHEKIIGLVLQLKPDMVIKDLASEPGLRRVLFTPLDWQLLRLCPAPLLLIRHGGRPRSGQVLAAVDPLNSAPQAEALDDRIVEAGNFLCDVYPAQLHLLHAFGGLPPVPVADATISPEVFAAAYEQLDLLHRQRFDAFAQRHGLAAAQTHLMHALPERAILELSRSLPADALVIGTVYRSGLGRALIGSTAERVLGQLDCDVLAVKPDGFEQELPEHLRRGAPEPSP